MYHYPLKGSNFERSILPRSENIEKHPKTPSFPNHTKKTPVISRSLHNFTLRVTSFWKI